MRSNAFSTQLTGPPFLKAMPLQSLMTNGLTLLGVTIVGEAAAASPTPAALETNSRRLILLLLPMPPSDSGELAHHYILHS